MPEEFDRAYWEERYRGHGHTAAHGGRPNPQLAAETGDLTPGIALEAGCGEGANAFWLASRGWRVRAVDIAATALTRAREHARALGTDTADRIEWVRADLTEEPPAKEHFDLVCAHYVHPTGPYENLSGHLAAAVAPGGTLFIVGHHPSDQHTSAPHASETKAHLTAEEVTAGLDPDRWDVVVAEARTRAATGPGGQEVTLNDSVLRARKRP